MKEIGGYLEFENFNGAHYHNYPALNTARASLLFLLKTLGAKKIFLPYYLCDSVKNYLHLHNFNYEFYHINSSFLPLFDKVLAPKEYLLIVNTYGQLTSDTISMLKLKYDNIILDNTHAFFEKAFPNIHTLYSCRKFFGIPDGAYLHIANMHNLHALLSTLERDVSFYRLTPLLGRYEESASKHYSKYIETEDELGTIPPLQMSKLTNNLLNAIDYSYVINKRNENFQTYATTLNENNLLCPSILNGPFCYPYYVDNGFYVRKKLIEKRIYIPTLWTNITTEYGANVAEEHMAKNILPLPIDQRVSTEDIKYIISIIKEITL